MDYLIKKKYAVVYLSAILLLFFYGCSEIRLISSYDETVDKQVNELYKEVSLYMMNLIANPEVSGTDAVKREEAYNKVYLQIKAIQIRALAKDKNQIQIDQVAALLDNWDKLKELQKTKPTVSMIKNAQSSLEIIITAILKLEFAKKSNT